MKLVSMFLLAILLLRCGNGADLLTHNGVCGNYPDEGSSQYVLPIEIGSSSEIGQGNCSGASHFGSFRYSYDFSMPIGTNVVAARGGQVIEMVESNSDGNGCPNANYLRILHSDGTIASYVHLTQNGVTVNLGAVVSQGDVIGLSGNTGCSTGPHLHFHVVSENGGETMAVTFSNTEAHPGGLLKGRTYSAN